MLPSNNEWRRHLHQWTRCSDCRTQLYPSPLFIRLPTYYIKTSTKYRIHWSEHRVGGYHSQQKTRHSKIPLLLLSKDYINWGVVCICHEQARSQYIPTAQIHRTSRLLYCIHYFSIRTRSNDDWVEHWKRPDINRELTASQYINPWNRATHPQTSSHPLRIRR